MANETASLVVRISGESDALAAELSKVQKQTENLENQLKSVGKISGVIFAALVGAGGAAVVQFAKFQNQLTAVKTLLDENSFGAKGLEKGFKDLTKEVLKLGTKIPVSIDLMNKALFDTVSAGVDASQAVEVVGVAARLAVAGLTDVAIATDGITSALGAYGIAANDANLVAAKFFTAQKRGKTTIAELAGGFGLVAANAAAAGVSFEELLGAVSAVTVGSIRTNAAFTGLKALLAGIAAPTAKAAKEAKRLGVEFSASALRAQGLEGFLKSLTESEKFTKDSVTALFGSVEAQTIAFSLTGTQAQKFSEILVELKDDQKALDTATRAYNEQSQTLSNQTKVASQRMKILAIQIGEKLLPAAEAIILPFSKFILFLTESEQARNFALALGLAAAAITGLITVLVLGGLAFLKFRAAMLAAKISTAALKLGVQGLVGATGIGLLVIVMTELFLNWNTIWPAMEKVLFDFANNVKGLLGGLGDLLIGIFTLNPLKVASGLAKITKVFKKSIEEINTAKEGSDDALSQQEKDKNERLKIAQQKAADDAVQNEKDKLARIMEVRRIFNEEIFVQNEENDLMTQEQRDLFREKQFQAVKDEIQTEKEARNAADKEELSARVKKQNKFSKDQAKFGTAIAKVRKILDSDELKGFRQTTGSLAALSQSRSSILKTIGKAAQIANIAIDTARAAIGAVTALSFIPIVGPALGFAAAAAIVAFGAEKIRQVNAAQDGALVEGGMRGRDSVPFLLEPGELVVPRRNFNEVVGSVAAQRAAVAGGGVVAAPFAEEDREDIPSIVIGFDGPEASQVLTARQIEDTALGISRAS